MAYSKTVKVLGDGNSYQLAPNIKKYGLRDSGFKESRNGRFTLEHPLDPTDPHNSHFILKIVVKPDLKSFKMVTTTANGLKEVNIFTHPEADKFVEQLTYIIQNLIEKNVLARA